MRVIGVLDLHAGRAVHARAGARAHYAPVELSPSSPLGAVTGGDARALARAYVERLGLTELYAADLDAIGGGAPEDGLIAALAALGVPLWLDAGVASVAAARHAAALGAARVVVGLETLPSYEALGSICAALGGDRVAFSLDLHEGAPVPLPAAAGGRIAPREPVPRLAARAGDAGVTAIVLIDLARVGTGQGLDFETSARVRHAVPGLALAAGGGVRGPDDLARLAACGCDAALVATALHDGRIGSADVAAVRHVSPTR
ncbi:MAG: hisA/hisF family protein [Gemmatimonadetes bacterium]|nr:hisA/hisF family protein [Gemmatimonadota bacterium]